MSEISLFAGVMTGGILGSGWMIHSGRKEVRCAKRDGYFLIRERLGHYSNMKTACATIYHPPSSNINFVPSAYLLDSQQHDILLGVLKKIEAKSAAAAVVSVLAFDLVISNIPGCLGAFSLFLWGCACGVLLVALLFAVDAASHLGQPQFRSMDVDTAIRGRELQRELVHEMLKKEGRFRAFYHLAIVVLFVMALYWFLQAIST